MKHVMMTLVFFAGLVVTSVDAQSCNPICPPECCVTSCCKAGSSAAAVKAASGEISLATCSPEALSAMCTGKKMSKKEMRACQAACEASKASAASATPDHMHVAPVSSNIAPSCQPVCQSSGTGKESVKVSSPSAAPAAAKQIKG